MFGFWFCLFIVERGRSRVWKKKWDVIKCNGECNLRCLGLGSVWEWGGGGEGVYCIDI